MLFNSFDFLLFFPVVWFVQLWVAHRARNAVLLLASCFFYACWDWRYLGLVWVTIFTDYTIGRLLARTERESHRKWLVTISCVIGLGILGFFKYAGFLVESTALGLRSLGFDVPLWQLRIVLPIGISFHTFQSLSYVVDVYRRKLTPLRNVLDYALYVSFFPQVVAGPIERGAHLVPQITQPRRINWEGCAEGSWLILKGLFKKAVIADNLAPIVDRVFAESQPSGPEVWLALYAFAFQIYGDFAGYTDMARGVGKWLGFDLMLNFRRPYFAVDPSDFWQRWHISLSSWLRDYLYIPLGGNRGGLAMTCRNLMLTMVLGGLWHGASFTFLLWGALHGALLVVFRLSKSSPDNVSKRVIVGSLDWGVRVVVMFHVVCVTWLLFRADSVAHIGTLLQAFTGNWYVAADFEREVWQVVLLCGPLLIVQFWEERLGSADAISQLSLLPRSLAYSGMLLAILTLGNFGGREFIYFQF